MSLRPSPIEMESEGNPGVRSTRVVASNSRGEKGDHGLGGDCGALQEGASAAAAVAASAAAGGSSAAYGGSSASAGGSLAAYGGSFATAGALGSTSELLPDVQRPPGLLHGDVRGNSLGGSLMVHDGGPRGGVILPGPTLTQDGIALPEVCLTPRRAQVVNPFWSPEGRADVQRIHGRVDPTPAANDGVLLPGGPGSGQKSEQGGGRSGRYVEMDPVELFRLRCLREAEEKFTRGVARMNSGEDGSAPGSYHTATASGGVLGDMGVVHGQGRLPALQHPHPSQDQRLQMGFDASLDQRPLQVLHDSGALGAPDRWS